MVIAGLGGHPLSVICAVATRDTRGVVDLVAIDAESVHAQAWAVLEDVPVAAFRVGQPGSVENVAAIAEILSDYPDVPVVLEPALHCVDEDEAVADSLMPAFLDLILPLTTLLVVGHHDLPRLAGYLPETAVDADEEGAAEAGADTSEGGGSGADAAQTVARLQAHGVANVLVTGAPAHDVGGADCLYVDGGHVHAFAGAIEGRGFVGARGMLATAVSALLARGCDVPAAVDIGREVMRDALARGRRIGMGGVIPGVPTLLESWPEPGR